MTRRKKDAVPLPKEEIQHLLTDCLKKKGWTIDLLAERVGLAFAKRGQEPQRLSKQTIYNQLSAPSLSMDVLAKWCSVLEYPLEDFIAKRPYSEPGSLTDLSRKLDKVIKQIEALEKEVTALKKTNEQLFT